LALKPRLGIRLSVIKLSHISLVSVGLMFIFPFVYYRHENPLTSFDQEWWSAMLGLLALTLLAGREFWRNPEIPRIAQFPAALIVIVLLQALLGKMAYFDQALLYILYLLFSALLMMLGARLRACYGAEKIALVLAIALLVGAELNALVGVLQHYKLHTLLDAVVVRQVSAGVYGNIAQSNHFADYVALGFISLGLLFQLRRIKLGYVILLALPLLFTMTLSGSRSSWLYLLLMAILAWWGTRRDAGMRTLLRYSVMLVAGFGLMHLVVQLPFLSVAGNSTDTVQRLLAYNGGSDTSGSVRLYLWREAWLMFMQSPWLGVGFGQFAWHHFQMLPLFKPDNISGHYNNAHNLFFQLAAETGIAGLLALIASFGVWFHGLRRASPTASHWWGYSALGVLAIHSLLEYPMWYAYFVAVAAILLGAFDETRYRLELRNVGRYSLVMILLLGLLSMIQLRSGYQLLKSTLALSTASGSVAEILPRIRDGLIEVHGSLLSPYAETYMFSYAEVNSDHIKEKLELGNRVMRFLPKSKMVYRQAYLLAQNDQLEQAKQLLEQAIWSYPGNGNAHQLLVRLAEKDHAHFSALLEFAAQKEQEHARAVRQ
jgi:O-antigen ligase